MASVIPTNSRIIDMETPSIPEDVEIKSNTFTSATDVVAIARTAYNSGKTKSINFRKDQLKRLLLLFEENSEVIENAIYHDFKRPVTDSMLLETKYMEGVITKGLMYLDDWVKPEKPKKPIINFLDKIRIHDDSLGVVLIISSWNIPIQALFTPLVGAIAAGNCVILKPSEITRECESVIVQLVPKYLDKECYQVFAGGVEKMNELLAERFDYIFFTGSTFVGRIIHQAANKYLTPVTLELGGKSPCYIDDSANLNIAVRRIMWAKCMNAGQICVSPDYILCTKDVQQKIIPLVKETLREFYGDDVQSSPDYCRIVNNNHFKRLVKFLNSKENIAVGGKFDESECFIEPTILVNVSSNDLIMQEEIFGPILPIITVKNANEAVNYINRGEKPLIFHVFTLEKDVKDLFINNTSSGMITINDTFAGILIDTLPFGGVGFSGMGAYHGKFTYDTFVHKKGVYETHLMPSLDKVISMRYPPFSNKKTKIILQLMKPKSEKFLETLKGLLSFISGAVFVIIIILIYNAIKT